MILAILLLLALMRSMERLIEDARTALSAAAVLDSAASLSACRALSAFCLTAPVISSMEAAVSSSELD